jgi:anti-sigma B factor antagonist
VSSGRCPGYVVVALRGEIDKTHAAWLARALSVTAVSGSRVIVDLEGLAFIDCSGLSAMVSAWKQARQAGGELRRAAPEQLVLRLLSLTDLTGLLPVFASVDQAASVDQVANGDGRSPAPPWLAREQADGEAPPGNGEVHRAGDDASPEGAGLLSGPFPGDSQRLLDVTVDRHDLV